MSGVEMSRPGKIDPCEYCFGVTRHDPDCRAVRSATTPEQGLDAATIERAYVAGFEQGWEFSRDESPTDAAEQYADGYVRALNTASTTTRGEDARLREALEAVMKRQGFAEPTFPDGSAPSDDVFITVLCTLGDLRRARTALQGDAAHTSQEKGG